MAKFRFKLKVTGLELEIEGSREDASMLGKSVSAQISSLLRSDAIADSPESDWLRLNNMLPKCAPPRTGVDPTNGDVPFPYGRGRWGTPLRALRYCPGHEPHDLLLSLLLALWVDLARILHPLRMEALGGRLSLGAAVLFF